MKDNIVLIGMPASGKSTAGVILAKILGMRFVDTDLLLQERYGQKLADIIAGDGLTAFLAKEEETCLTLSVHNSVIATGGSVVYGEKAMQHLKSIGTVVYLHVDLPILQGRLHNVKQRGVVLRDGQTISDLYAERSVLYERYADLTVEEEDGDMEETVEALVRQLQDLNG
ncbi:MAG: shikimate kinase [Lachnospiraceae bacterium]|nr:shikimate kinase [Lachnospiraceae bacterium]